MKKISLILLFFVAITTKAQKLPEIQILAPSVPLHLKIDGKDLEWNNSYAAENKKTTLFYNLTNDDKNIYLVLKSTDVTKIMAGGITFMVNLESKKREKEAIGITYPLVAKNNAAQRNRLGQNRQGGFQNNTNQTNHQRDSIMSVLRKTQLAAAKEIKVFGFKNISDSLISIYNEYGIKAFATIDKEGSYFCEMAIPLTNLKASAAEISSFYYQIKVNGLPETNLGNTFQRNANGLGAGGGGGGRGFNALNKNANTDQDLIGTTNFWGKYTLVTK